MHDLDECLRVFRRDFGEDAVAEVEDVAGAMLGSREHLQRSAADRRDVGEQRDRIEVALNGDIVANGFPAVAQIDSPIEADDVAAPFTEQRQQRAAHVADVP